LTFGLIDSRLRQSYQAKSHDVPVIRSGSSKTRSVYANLHTAVLYHGLSMRRRQAHTIKYLPNLIFSANTENLIVQGNPHTGFSCSVTTPNHKFSPPDSQTTVQMRHPNIQAAHRSCISKLWTTSPTVSNTPRGVFRPHVSLHLQLLQFRHQHTQTPAPTRPQPLQDLAFWKCRHTWRRAMVNTTRCLIGCSLGDLSTMYYLMTYHPAMNAVTSMGLSSKFQTYNKR
jgi:hypothetical protein